METTALKVLILCALLLATTTRAHADEGEAWDGSTISEQVGGGLGLGVAGGTERAGWRPSPTVDVLIALTCVLAGPVTGYQLTF